MLWIICSGCCILLLGYFLFHIIKPYMKVTVNCWFCNENSSVPYPLRKSFICSKCGQYNGFTEDGDYDRCIPEQKYEHLNPQPPKKSKFMGFGGRPDLLSLSTHNGLCHQCNSQQNLIQAQINKFEARNEKNYFNELNDYKDRLYRAYPLCSDCEKYMQMKIEHDKEKLGLTGVLAPTPRGLKTASALSASSYRSPSRAVSQIGGYGRNTSTIKPNRRRRAAHFNCGFASNSLNILTFVVSLFLFVAHFIHLQSDSDIELFDLTSTVPSVFLSPWLISRTYELSVGGFISHLISLRVMRSRRSFPDIIAFVIWGVLIFLKLGNPTKDYVLYQFGFSSVLTVVAFAVTFLPRKLLHRKKPNSILQSAFSVSSTPISQCSTLSQKSTPSIPMEISTESSYIKPEDPWSDIRRRETTPSRELGSLLSGLSLGKAANNKASGSEVRRRGPFDSMRRPILSAPRLRIGEQTFSYGTTPISSRYVQSNAPSMMTSASQIQQPTFTLFNIFCAFATLFSVCVNLFMFYHLFYLKND